MFCYLPLKNVKSDIRIFFIIIILNTGNTKCQKAKKQRKNKPQTQNCPWTPCLKVNTIKLTLYCIFILL